MAKVLIIDDEMQLRRLLSRIIGLEGYEVAEAADCASGMKMLRQHEPDVVLCDVKLPDGSGISMSTQYYTPPYSDNIEGKGVLPDIVSAMDLSKLFQVSDDQDTQLQAGLQALQ